MKLIIVCLLGFSLNLFAQDFKQISLSKEELNQLSQGRCAMLDVLSCDGSHFISNKPKPVHTNWSIVFKPIHTLKNYCIGTENFYTFEQDVNDVNLFTMSTEYSVGESINGVCQEMYSLRNPKGRFAMSSHLIDLMFDKKREVESKIKNKLRFSECRNTELIIEEGGVFNFGIGRLSSKFVLLIYVVNSKLGGIYEFSYFFENNELVEVCDYDEKVSMQKKRKK